MLSLLLVLIRSKHFTARLSVLSTPTISIDILIILNMLLYNTVYNLYFLKMQYSMMKHSMHNINYITCFKHAGLFTVLKYYILNLNYINFNIYYIVYYFQSNYEPLNRNNDCIG